MSKSGFGQYYLSTLPVASVLGSTSVARLASETWAFARLGETPIAAFACVLPLAFLTSGALYGISLATLSLLKSERLSGRTGMFAGAVVGSVLTGASLALSPVVPVIIGVDSEVSALARTLLVLHSITLLPMTCSVVLTAVLKHRGLVRTADTVALLTNLVFVAIIAWLASGISMLQLGASTIMVVSLLVNVCALIALIALVPESGSGRNSVSLNSLNASKELARRGAPVFGSNLIGGLYFLGVGRVMVSAGGDSSVAVLGLLMRAEQIVLVGVSVISMTAMPLVSRHWSCAEERMKAIWSGYALASVWGLAAAVLGIVVVLYSPSFSVVLGVGSYYMTMSPLIFVSLGALALCSSVLVVAGKEQVQFWIAVVRVLPLGILPLLIVAEYFDVSLALGWYGLANLLATPIAIRYVYQLRTSS